MIIIQFRFYTYNKEKEENEYFQPDEIKQEFKIKALLKVLL